MSAGHTSRVSPLLTKVEAFVHAHPKGCGASDIMKRFRLDPGTAGRLIGELVRSLCIVAIGTAAQAGRKDLNRCAVIYAKRGTPMLPATPGMKRGKPGPKGKRKVQPAPGSGVISGRRYVAPLKTPAPTVTKEHQDRAALAMLVR
jgi:hypothetical protein